MAEHFGLDPLYIYRTWPYSFFRKALRWVQNWNRATKLDHYLSAIAGRRELIHFVEVGGTGSRQPLSDADKLKIHKGIAEGMAMRIEMQKKERQERRQRNKS